MSRIVHVKHPVPYRYIPSRGHKEQVVIGQAEVPVRLREADPDEFAPVPDLRGGVRPFFTRAGRPWARIGRTTDGTFVPMPPADFEAWLEGRLPYDKVEQVALKNHLYATPLLAADPLRSPRQPPQGSRGEPTPAAVLARAPEDLAGECRANVARFLEEEVAMAGGTVYVRMAGPLMSLRETPLLVMFPRIQFDENLAVHLHRLDDLLGLGAWTFREVSRGVREMRESVGPNLGEMDDVHLFVNNAPRLMLANAQKTLRNPPRGGEEAFHAIQSRCDALGPWALRALTGSIAPDAYDDVIPLVVELGEAVERGYPTDNWDSHILRKRLMAFATVYAQPQARRAAQLEPGDADALSALGMGGP